ncbi:MocR-like pyridoxine biosynthesis transcription factor PdxR [Albidovulum sp.]
MQISLFVDPNRSKTLQRQVVDQIRRMILTGRLKGGDPMPGSRALATQLGVSRNTVIIAYEHLVSEGYLVVRPNLGTFVTDELPDQSLNATPSGSVPKAAATGRRGPGMLDRIADRAFPVQELRNAAAGRLHTDFWLGRVDPEVFPVAEWRRILDLKLRFGHRALTEYGDPQGLAELRRAIADHLGPARGISCTEQEVVITAGSQEALMLIARAAEGEARVFLHEDPGYGGAIHLCARSGVECRPVPVDREGLIVEALPEEPGAMLYVTPSHQFPTGVTLSLARRLELLAWAERTDSLIVEDDYDGDFRHDGSPLTALRGIDTTGRVLFVGTFSKSLSPVLRIGYIVGTAAAARTLGRWKQLLTNGPPWHMQATLADFMESGAFARHLRRIRRVYHDRRDALIAAIERHFPGSEILGRRGGMHIAWRLPDHRCARRLQRQALMRGIGIYTAEDGGACLSPGNDRHRDLLMLGYAAVPEGRIRAAIADLAAIAGET